jgi:ATP-dependent helicase/nuclease subunit A
VATRDTEWLQRQREELNALYVALTRARDTLVLSSIVPHREAPGSWWQRLFEQAQPVTPPAPAAIPLARATAAAFDMLVLPPAPQAAAAASVPTQDVEGLSPAASDPPSARIGKAMHRLLEWGSVDVAHGSIVQREFGLDAEQAQTAASMAQRVLTGEGAWAWDAEQLAWAANEVELVHGGVLMRLDRLLQRKDDGQWWVLDHKSHPAPLKDPELVAQLGAYRAAVRAIYPGQVVRAAFLTGEGRWVELPEQWP